MGSFQSTPEKKDNINILVQGPKGAGKTTIMHKMNFDRDALPIPMKDGSYMMKMHCRNVTFLVCDVSPHTTEEIPLQFENIDALIFVVDAHDRSRLVEARECLHQMVQHQLFQDIPVLVMSNKSDFDDCLSSLEITEQLQMYKVPQNCTVFSTSADDGRGLYEALDWLCDAFKQQKHLRSETNVWQRLTNFFR